MKLEEHITILFKRAENQLYMNSHEREEDKKRVMEYIKIISPTEDVANKLKEIYFKELVKYNR